MAATKGRSGTAGQLKPAPPGMILVVTIVALLLISLMGAAIVLNTTVEMHTAGNTVSGRDAFTRADSIMRVATILTEVVQNPALGAAENYIHDGQSVYKLNPDSDHQGFNEDSFTAVALVTDPNRSSIDDRYLRAGQTDRGDRARDPDLTFWNDQSLMLATAVVSRDFDFLTGGNSSAYSAGQTVGASAGIAGDGNSGDSGVKEEIFVITATGRPPSSQAGDFFGVDAPAEGQEVTEEMAFGPNSVLTVIFRSIIL